MREKTLADLDDELFYAMKSEVRKKGNLSEGTMMEIIELMKAFEKRNSALEGQK